MPEKADSDLVRRQNRRLVLTALRQNGPLARIELGRLTGLSPASITSITGQLIGDGIIEECADSQPAAGPLRRGRPLTRIDLNPAAAHVVAAKISIDGLELALATYRGTVIARQVVAVSTYEADAASFGGFVASEIKAFLTRNRMPPKRVARAGIAVQGAADSTKGTIMWSPAFRERNIPVTGPVEAALGIPCVLANDANMIAEGIDGPRDSGTTAVVFIGYGVGMGLIIDGRVYHGPTGAAAEFGHMNHVPHGALCRCGRRGCIEAYAADYGIRRSAEGKPGSLPPRSGVPRETMRALQAAASRGDAAALAAYRQAGDALGFGLARLIALLNPTRIILAGPGTEAMPLIEPHLLRAIDDGVVDELRRNLEISVVPIDTDMIIVGTVNSALRSLDAEVFSAGPLGKPVLLQTPA